MKKKLLIICGAVAIAFAIQRCVEPYEARSIDFDKVVVVDGILTNEAGVQQVKLSYTTPIDSTYLNPITGAEVWVQDGSGTREDFSETSPGIYRSSDSYSGVAGQTYQLFFTTPEGRTYESEVDELIPSPEIDSIYDRYKEVLVEAFDGTVPGIQFFLDSHDETGRARHFRYEWEHTFQIIPDFPSQFDFNKEDSSITRRTDNNDIATCYLSGFSSELIIKSSVGSSANRVVEVPIKFLSRLTPELRNRYSLQATQYAISQGAYNYYSKLIESIESTGSLFDKQQGTIVGNIHAQDDPNEPVLGYFELAGVSKKRAFFRYDEFDRRMRRAVNYYQCEDFDILTTVDEPIIIGDDTLTLYTYLNPEELDTNRLVNEKHYVVNLDLTDGFFLSIAPRRCTVCDFYGSTEQPDFWPEKFY